MRPEKVQLLPDPRVVFSIANQNLNWWHAFGEWIDNALDADASTISIAYDQDRLVIEDDGVGCTDPKVMLRLGAHKAHSTAGSGIFGVGGKDAALWAGNLDSSILIESVRNGSLRCVSVSWQDYIRDGYIIEHPERGSGGRGTTIKITRAKSSRNLPHGKDWERLLRRLAYTFAPALENGIQIKFRRNKARKWEPLVRWQPPALVGDIIDARTTIAGKAVRIRCGVVSQGEQYAYQGITYYHGKRVIQAATANGCGHYGPARVYGEVWLEGQWPRTKNKDALNNDNDTVQHLYSEVARICEPALIRAYEASQELESEAFNEQVNAALKSMLAPANARAKRGQRRNRTGTKKSTGEGSKHKRAEQEQGGDTFKSQRAGMGRFRVDYANLGDSSAGQVKPPVVLLNLDNELVENARGRTAVQEVAIIACSLIVAEHCFAPQGQFALKGFSPGQSTEEFSSVFGSLISGGLALDGRPVLKIEPGEAA